MASRGKKIGVLALQGAVREHLRMLGRCGADATACKAPEQLSGLDGLIIPGGESTTIGKLMTKYGWPEVIRAAYDDGLGIFGTCAGLILLAERISEGDQPLLALMDIEARRNAFGRQLESFEEDLDLDEVGPPPFRAVFIRAPWIEDVGPAVKVLAESHGHTVMARQGRVLVSAFHPELTDDLRVHRYFLENVVPPSQT